MPTPKGLPQKGDRVMMRSAGPAGLALAGTVTARGLGSYWSLTIRWDGERNPLGVEGREKMYVDASWLWDRGDLRLQEEK